MAHNDELDLETLMRLFQDGMLPLVEGRWYNNVVLPLDGYHFKSCRFDGCTLTYQTGNFILTQCFLSPITRIIHPVAALRSIKLYNHAAGVVTPSAPMPAHVIPFAPTYHPNGTLSVP